MRSSVIDLGKTREAKSKNAANLVSEGDRRLVDNTWFDGRQLAGWGETEESDNTECLVRHSEVCNPHRFTSHVST